MTVGLEGLMTPYWRVSAYSSNPYGTGVMLQDLHGNKIYLNQDPVWGQ